MLLRTFFASLVLLLVACVSVPSAEERKEWADTLAAEEHWQRQTIPSGRFDLVAYIPRQITRGNRLSVYIEGDGLAWINGSQASSDPTPRNPIALRLALAHPQGNAAYLARPCQYVDSEKPPCNVRYWTGDRFAPEVIDATSQALDTLKEKFAAHSLTLVGYSGGGAVAALVAARRQDVAQLITVAGNLDHQAWTTLHRVQPLTGSLNAADAVQGLATIPQLHFVGGRDRIVPPILAQGFASRFPVNQQPRVIVEPDFDHQCCWVENWRRLFSREGNP